MLRERRRHANYKPNRRLDRKSSRGMIYENEELRLRTININAEVERGQSDIRKLRRENEQLRREIWSLRDEYDRLNKLLKTHKTTDNDGYNSENSHSEGSDSCDTCKDEDIEEEIKEEKCSEKKISEKTQQNKTCNQEIFENYENSQKSLEQKCNTSADISNTKQKEDLHVNFDHLSIVSEENLTNSDGSNSVQHGDMDMSTSLIQSPSKQRIVDERNVEKAKRMSDIQSIIPPLSYFENIEYDKLGPNKISLEEVNCSSSTTTTGETVIPVNGWDFSYPSPHSFHTGSNLASTSAGIGNLACGSQKSPKHFFSPIKPRTHLEPQCSTTSLGNGPDIFVSNALASPYQRSNLMPAATPNPIEPFSGSTLKSTLQSSSPLPFQRGGNLDDLLSDLEILSNDILQMARDKQKSCSQEKLDNSKNSCNRKPYRSEMNLVLTYNGSNPVITPIAKKAISSSTNALDAVGLQRMDTPPPFNLSEPTILFPQNLTYLGFKYGNEISNLTANATNSQTVILKKSQEQTSSAGPLYPTVLTSSPSDYIGSIRMPTPPVCDMTFPPGPLIKDLYYKSSSNTSGRNVNSEYVTKSPTAIRKKVASRPDDPQNSRSYDTRLTALTASTSSESNKMYKAESSMSENANCDVQSSSESGVAKRKSRRVSILFRKSEEKQRGKTKDSDGKAGENSADKRAITPSHSEPEVNITSGLTTESDKSNKKSIGATHSTPNSPHSSGRHNVSAHHLHSHHHHHHHHHQQSSNRKTAQDSGVKKASVVQQPNKMKFSRRHSEGTLMTSLLPSTAGDRVSQGVQEDYHESLGIPISERSSNNFTSSRESSTSLSTRSQHRKISISSHNGGKIPWCGCWGNGCV